MLPASVVSLTVARIHFGWGKGNVPVRRGLFLKKEPKLRATAVNRNVESSSVLNPANPLPDYIGY